MLMSEIVTIIMSVIIVTAFKTWEMKVIVPQTSCPAVTAKLVNEWGSIQS